MLVYLLNRKMIKMETRLLKVDPPVHELIKKVVSEMKHYTITRYVSERMEEAATKDLKSLKLKKKSK